MKLKAKIPILKKVEYKKYFNQIGLKNLVKESLIKRNILLNQLPEDLNFTLPPELNKLYFLHQFILLNKRINILEFGSGWSSVIFSHSLNQNKNKYNNIVNNKIRRVDPFKLLIIETYKKFIKYSENKIIRNLGSKINNYKFLLSKVQMTSYDGNICTEYLKLPLFSPDFIYLDGPDQRNVLKKINGITTNYTDFFPMSCDLLKIEFFLIPGTILIVDGRGANADFLKKNFKRKWKYQYIKEVGHHIFTLNEQPLGTYNLNQIKFYNK